MLCLISILVDNKNIATGSVTSVSIPYYNKNSNNSPKGTILTFTTSDGIYFATNQLYFFSASINAADRTWNTNVVVKAGTGAVMTLLTDRDYGRNKDIYIASLQLMNSYVTYEIYLDPLYLNKGSLKNFHFTGTKLSAHVYPLR